MFMHGWISVVVFMMACFGNRENKDSGRKQHFLFPALVKYVDRSE